MTTGGNDLQDKDDEDEDLEHGKAHDDMWILDTTKYTVKLLQSHLLHLSAV